ncbi:MAG: leucine-rich repeat domain-containing protein [Lachnospiraceae bacterium]|nr:leucine-rich repeat domain-containing protein [Lachnospiraceae bacterium]
MKSKHEIALNMRKLLNFLAGGIATALLFSCLLTVETGAATVCGSLTTADGLKYNLFDDGSATVSTYSGAATELIIPSVVAYDGTNYTVKYIGTGVFYDKDFLERVTLPDTIVGIGNGAFRDCGSLKKINLPEGLQSVGEVAFSTCESLKEVNLPSTLTTLGNSAFAVTAIESLTIPASLTDIGARAFQTCRSLKSVTLPSNMTTIPEEMFTNCSSLTDLSFIKNVTTIGTGAFSACTGLTALTIPKSVTTIGDRAFTGCTNIKTTVISDGVTTIGRSAFSGCTALESVQMTDSVTSLGNAVFYGCSALTDICLSNSITSIGDNAFENCRGLSYIVVPEGVTSIGSEAFYNCSGLEYVILPSTLETTGSNLYTIRDGNNRSYIPVIFYPAGTTAPSEVVKVKASYEENEDGTISVTIDYVSSYAEDAEISIPESIGGKPVTSVEYGPDANDSYSVTFSCAKHYAPKFSINELQHFYAVCNICKKTNVNVQAHSYGDGTKKCVCGYVPFALTSASQDIKAVYGYADAATLAVTVTATLGKETIAYQWYENGKAISGATDTSYKIPTGKNAGTYTYVCKVTCGGYAVSSAQSTFTVEKPASSDNGTADSDDKGNDSGTENAGTEDNSTGENTSRSSVATEDAKYEITDEAGQTVEYTKPKTESALTVTVPTTITVSGKQYKVTSIAKNAFRNNKKLKKVVIGSNIKTIGANAFYGCTNLKKVTIGKNVSKIGLKAFYKCKKLKTIIIKTTKLSKKKVGSKAFGKIHAKATVKVPKKKLKAYRSMLRARGISKKAKIKK